MKAIKVAESRRIGYFKLRVEECGEGDFFFSRIKDTSSLIQVLLLLENRVFWTIISVFCFELNCGWRRIFGERVTDLNFLHSEFMMESDVQEAIGLFLWRCMPDMPDSEAK